MAITVTLTAGAAARMGFAVKVLTGAAARTSQPGATATSTTATSVSVTPAANGSVLYGCHKTSHGTYPYTMVSGCTASLDGGSGAGGTEIVTFRTTGTVSAGTPVTAGVVAQGAESFITLSVAEILAAGTIAEDASSPATVPLSGSATLPFIDTLTTGPFTPPGGSLLVATGAIGGNSASLSVSDSSGLTWTPAALVTNSSSAAGVWVAQVPVSATAPAGLASGAGAALATAFAYAPAGLPTGVAAALQAAIGGQAVAVTAGLATATGLAQPAQARYPVTAMAGLATASGTAQSATTHGPIPAVQGKSRASAVAGATSQSSVGEAATCISSVT